MKVSNKFLFDMTSVEAIEPGEKEKIVWDEEVEGFGLRVLPSGTRSWLVSSRVRGEDGKTRRRRVTIGRFGDVGLEDARNEARKVLARSEEAGKEGAAGAVREEDVGTQAEGTGAGSADTSRNIQDGGEGEARVAPDDDVKPQEAEGADAGSADTSRDVTDVEEGAKWVDPDDDVEPQEVEGAERIDPETGEVLSGSGEEEDGGWVDDGLDLNALKQSAAVRVRAAAREEEGGPDRAAVDDVLSGVLAGIDDGVRERGEGDAGRSEGPEPVSGEGKDERAVSEAVDGTDVTDEDSSPSPEGNDGSARSGRGAGAEMVRKVGGAMAMVAGQAARLGRKGKEVAEAARPDRGSGSEPEDEAVRGPVEAAGGDDVGIEEVPPPARLAKRQRRDEGTEEGNREGRQFSDETAAGVARNLDEAGGLLDRIAETGEELMPLLEDVSSSLRLFSKDVRSWRRRWVGPAVALVVMAPVLVGAGMLIQSRVTLLPQDDPSLGWSGHIWGHYGSAFMDCFDRAKKAKSGRAACEIEVRAR